MLEPIDSSSLAKLCEKCQKVINSWFQALKQEVRSHYELEIGHYARISDLEKSAYDGCGLCARFIASLSQLGISILRSVHARTVDDNHWKNRISVDDTDSKEWLLSSYFNPPVLDGRGFPIAPCTMLVETDHVNQSSFEISTGAPPTLALIVQWAGYCLANHKDCGAIRKDLQRPTRLLELLENGVRLCSPAGMETAPSYLTLSHCWGSLNVLKLRRDNLETLHQGIPKAKLCKTFQDAIHLTKQLGVRYLWIDSLCIIQDDEEDWRRESVSMAKIYGQATLCLAATGAADGSEGLFFNRETVKVRRQFIQTPDRQLWEILDRRLYRRCISNTPLSDRAWAFQERYLSTRTLHFTREQVFWECGNQVSCETYPDGLPSQVYGKNLKSLSRTASLSARSIWTSIISDYSICRLTYAKDKLVAISGVAHSMAVPELGQYLAGMWRRDLEEQLCWRVHSAAETEPSSDPKSGLYRAPSWSWASVDFPVFLPHQSTTMRLLSHVQAASTTALGPDEYGEVSDARLQLKCYPLLDAKPIMKRQGTNLFRTFHLTYEDDANEPHMSVWNDRSVLSKVDLYWDWRIEPSKMEKDIYLLPILTSQQNTPRLTSCLLITTSDRDAAGLFTRVGICTLHLETTFEDFIRASLKASPGSFMNNTLYEAVGGVNEYDLNEYLITLV